MLIAGAYRVSWLAIAILIGTLAAVLLGRLQVGSADPVQSPWYLYQRTNTGSRPASCANSNTWRPCGDQHPVAVALIADLRRKSKNPRAGSAVLLLAVREPWSDDRIFLNGSLAVLLLACR